ncbi:probable G-protein coupled receptor CG31760 [Trichonephila clavipes]|nr:probable G-protein coupled receptor CG31760 [Trichonephila clavipes]
MLVRLPRAPVLSGGLRRKTQLFSGTLYMAASSKTPPHQSKAPQKFNTPLQVPVFPGSSLLCRHTSCEKPSDTTSFHSVLVCHRTSSQFYRVIKGQGDVWDNRARARGVTASFSLNGVGPVYEEPQDLYQENEELKEEVQKLASQIEFMKIVHMEVNNRHLKPKHGGFFSQPTTNQSPVIKNIYMKFESTDSPGSRISPAAELVSEKNWLGAAQIYGVLLPKEMGEVILEFFALQIRGIRKALFGIEGTAAIIPRLSEPGVTRFSNLVDSTFFSNNELALCNSNDVQELLDSHNRELSGS